ncbi:dihydrofolate reductase [Pararhizobium mangrovi]|uniref:Dihydrofolate reductase n=1 Tax=Pararhizobium mangrovi TaxID=2590452 RepID=A0A506UI30_9HYPH|nr:dihydrofolate reductase [Pararhizobium mangrovi]
MQGGIRIEIVLAMAQNGVIGRDNALPWRLSADLKRFKALTMEKPLIMGRRTFESLPGILPGRPHIVLTRDADYVAEKAEVVHDFDAAVRLAAKLAREQGAEAMCVIGGRALFERAIGEADSVHLTHVQADVEGDTRMADLDLSAFDRVSETCVPADEKNEFPTRYVEYRCRLT